MPDPQTALLLQNDSFATTPYENPRVTCAGLMACNTETKKSKLAVTLGLHKICLRILIYASDSRSLTIIDKQED